MTHEGAPAVFVIHEVAAVRAVIQRGARRRDGLHYPPILKSPADQRCPREERPRRKGSLIML